MEKRINIHRELCKCSERELEVNDTFEIVHTKKTERHYDNGLLVCRFEKYIEDI